MLSLAKPHEFYQFLLAQGFGMGMGMGCMFLPALSIMSHYFRRRRAVAMGIVVASAFSCQSACESVINVLWRRVRWGRHLPHNPQ